MDWRIYYGDSTTFSSDDGSPDDAPSLNIQAIAVKRPGPDRGYVVHSYDFYWYEDGDWYAGDLFGVFDFLTRSGKVKFARSVKLEEFQAIMKRATDDPLLDEV